jgi:cysteine-rich repeat protein
VKLTLCLSLSTLLVSAPAWAVRPAAHLARHSGLELWSGEALPEVRALDAKVPPATEAAWRRFTDGEGGTWLASFDRRTGVPSQIWGSGLAAPGAVESPKAAEAFATAFLARHLDLLAPGAVLSDLVLAANDLDDGLRTVAFVQRHRGERVIGGQLSFRFKADRMFLIASAALPEVAVPTRATLADPAQASLAAREWIGRDFAAPAATAGPPSAPMILPLVQDAGRVEYQEVLLVMVDSVNPIGRWAVYVGAGNGRPIARRQTLLFADGTLFYNAPLRWPGGGRSDQPASEVYVQQGATQLTTTASGTLTWTGTGSAALSASVLGPEVQVINNAGSNEQGAFTMTPGGSFTWNRGTVEPADAQLITYLSVYKIKQKMKQIAPELTMWVDGNALPANVNLNMTCNAFSDGNTVNFFLSGMGCENTGRLPDVIYHESGHTFHYQAIIPGVGQFDTPLSEGAADYLCVTYTGDPGMGRGFFFNDMPLRNIDPPDHEARWPDDINSDPHITGEIFSGAVWDLRKLLIIKYGEGPGIAKTDRLYYETLRRAVDIPSTYAEILAADDDDGNLANGTPDSCEIISAFEPHGLVDATTTNYGISPPRVTTTTVTLPVTTLARSCPGTVVTSAQLTWQLESNPMVGGQLAMNQNAGVGWVAHIPSQPDDTVVRYKVVVTFASGATRNYPDNPADPMYQVYFGSVTPLYCTDFEAHDPAIDGWTHRLVSGTNQPGADDWQWGTPVGQPGSYDPRGAYSGTHAIGNDLGFMMNWDGLYQPNIVNEMSSPVISTTGFKTVRLQYRRWLSVEDGFYDQATIWANNKQLWANLDTGANHGTTAHIDKEWRFHDVDLSSTISADRVQVRFQLASDAGLEYGGWNIDDFCVVGLARCGDGITQAGEQCDDGAQNGGPDCNTDCTKPRPTHSSTTTPMMGGQPDPTETLPEAKSAGCGCAALPGATRDGAGTRAGPWLVLGLFLARHRRTRPRPISDRRASSR